MPNSSELINKIKGYNKFLNLEKLDKAYNFAVKAHQNQKRDSGDPYFFHPLAVANILADYKLDWISVTTALLHDTVEDEVATRAEIRKLFGVSNDLLVIPGRTTYVVNKEGIIIHI